MQMIDVHKQAMKYAKAVKRIKGKLSETERSEAPQGCLPSANCSAGAGADARSDSLISSVVPREKAVGRGSLIRNISRLQEQNRLLAECLAEERGLRKRAYKHYQIRLQSRFAWVADLIAITFLSKSDAGHCKGQRALARNEKGQR